MRSSLNMNKSAEIKKQMDMLDVATNALEKFAAMPGPVGAMANQALERVAMIFERDYGKSPPRDDQSPEEIADEILYA